MRIHFAGKLFFTLCLLTITTCLISAAPSKKAPEFPEGFPEELRKAKFLKKESRILAPGFMYCSMILVLVKNSTLAALDLFSRVSSSKIP